MAETQKDPQPEAVSTESSVVEHAAHKARSRFVAAVTDPEVRRATRRAAPWLLIAGAVAVPPVGIPAAGAGFGALGYGAYKREKAEIAAEQAEAEAKASETKPEAKKTS